MRYQINDFVFDTTSLVLTSHGKPQEIRHNEAKVLALLLREQDQVISKETILSEVWQDKVVSEQAVFQNISHLRGLFGNGAIKTFPKRGYQWQLSAQVITDEIQPVDPVIPITAEHQVSNSSDNTRYDTRKWFAAAALLFLCVIGWFAITYSVNSSQQAVASSNITSDAKATDTTDITDSTKNSAIAIAYFPFVVSSPSISPSPAESSALQAQVIFTDSDFFDFTALTHLSSDEFTISAELEYPKLQAEHPFVLSGDVRLFEQTYYLDFALKGPAQQWQGQITGKTIEEVTQRLAQHLQQPFIYELLTKAQPPEVKLATLSIAHQRQPTDLIILTELAQSYIVTNELEKAMVMAEKLATNAVSQNDAFFIWGKRC